MALRIDLVVRVHETGALSRRALAALRKALKLFNYE